MEQKEFQIGQYRITKTLGQGTFGKVKEGVHVLTGQKVAIKILDKSKITDVNDVERVSREIHILKIVRHPHIIQLYETIETPNKLFLIMENCCNGELFSFITSKNKLKEEEACKLFQQLISALTYLGKLGIVHRDVKPENLLLDQQLNLKMIDFGLSNMYKPGEKLATACGSPCYAAPELIKGLEYIGPKADLWSAGVVLFTMVCGHLPFEDSNTQSLYQKILNARYKFTCYLSQEIQSLVKNILVPDPELRYGLKQVMSNTWYKKTFQSPEKLSEGIEVGIDQIKIFDNVIQEMQSTEDISVDFNHVKLCLQAHVHNPLTAYYYLLLKKKIIQGEPLDDLDEDTTNQVLLMTQERQTKRYQSIEPVRTTLYDQKNKYQLRKIAEGLNDFNIMRVNAPGAGGSNTAASYTPTDVMSPLAQTTTKHSSNNSANQQQLQNQLLLMSPDQMIFSSTQLDSHGLISPTLVAFDNREKLQQQVQKAYQEQRKQILHTQNSQQSSQMSSKKNSGQILNGLNNSGGGQKGGSHSNAAKRNLQTINAIQTMGQPSPNTNLSTNKKGQGGKVTRNQRFLNKTIEPMTNVNQGASSNLMAGQFDLLTPQQLPPHPKQLNAKGGASTTFEMHNNDYTNVQHHSLFSNRNEERKTTRFKKNNPGDQRGYGKPQKYQSQKASSVSSGAQSSQNNQAIKTANLMNNSSNNGGTNNLPHSLLEKEIRQIMNQSQLVQSTKENDMSFNHQGSNHLRRVANQRLSAMSNYENNISGGTSQTINGPNNNTRGSQQFMNHNNQAASGGSQMIRQGKGKARNVNSMLGGKDGFNKSAEKTGPGHQRNQTQMMTKSIQDGKINLPKPSANHNHARKASMGIISPTQNSQSLFENKLVFSGSQLTTVKVDKVNVSGKPPTVKDKLNTTQPIKQQVVTKLHVQKQPQSSHKKQKVPNRMQPATVESLELGQFASEPQHMHQQQPQQQMLTTQQLSGLFQQINSNKQVGVQQHSGLQTLNPASIITSPNNVNHNAIISQFSAGPMSIVQSPHPQQLNSNTGTSKQTPQSIKQHLQDFQNMQLNQALILNNQIAASQFNSQGSSLVQTSKQRNHTGAKSAFNTTQPIQVTTKGKLLTGSNKGAQSTDRSGSIQHIPSQKNVKPRQQAAPQRQDSKRKVTSNSKQPPQSTTAQQQQQYYDSLLRFQNQDSVAAQSGLIKGGSGGAHHNRAVTSIGINPKFANQVQAGNSQQQQQWQQVNTVRVANHSQPQKNAQGSGGGITAGGTGANNGKKGNSASRNTKAASTAGTSFGNYVANANKVVNSGGVTNFNVYQHIQNLNQTTIMSPDQVARTPQEFKQQIRQKRSYPASNGQT